MPTNFRITFGADFVPCTKLRGLSPPSFQVGGARAPAAPPAPTSLVISQKGVSTGTESLMIQLKQALLSKITAKFHWNSVDYFL